MEQLLKYQKLLEENKKYEDNKSSLSRQFISIKRGNYFTMELLFKHFLPSLLMIALSAFTVSIDGNALFLSLSVSVIVSSLYEPKKIEISLHQYIGGFIASCLLVLTIVCLGCVFIDAFTTIPTEDIAKYLYSLIVPFAPIVYIASLGAMIYNFSDIEFKSKKTTDKELEDLSIVINKNKENAFAITRENSKIEMELSSKNNISEIEYLEAYSEVENLYLVKEYISHLKADLIRKEGFTSQAEYNLSIKEKEFVGIKNY